MVLSRFAAAIAVFAAAAALFPLEARLSAPADPTAAREALASARIQENNARTRGDLLDRQAQTAKAASDKALVRAAALAARVQQAEAAVGVAESRLALVGAERRKLELSLARENQPAARLAGAVEVLSRRPTLLAMFQTGSLQDLVHTRAVLSGVLPRIERRTATLRSAIARKNALEREARSALEERRQATALLDTRRRDLLAQAESNRLLARRASLDAGREAARALMLAEEARDLDTLASRLEEAGGLRSRLAALPGPVRRPDRASGDSRPLALPAAAPASAPVPAPAAAQTAVASAPQPYILPANGRVETGFNELSPVTGARQPGIALAPRKGGQIVAPGAGRVAFAAPYRGYGSIVIIEHEGGWSSLVTGLAGVTVAVGQQVTAGSPLGRAAVSEPRIGLELRRDGKPVNPLDYLR